MRTSRPIFEAMTVAPFGGIVHGPGEGDAEGDAS